MQDLSDFVAEVMAGRAGAGLIVAAVGLALLFVFRRLLARRGRPRSTRGQIALYFIYLAMALALVFVSRDDHPTLRRYLSVAALLCLALALLRTLSMATFDYFLAARRQVHVPVILRDIGLAVLYVILVFIVLGEHGVDLTGVVTTSAVLTAVVGLALQDVLANVFAGLAVQFERAFDVGDWVQLGTHVGEVREIGWRSVKILTLSNDLVILPNNYVSREMVVNYSRPDPVHRRQVQVGVHYRHPPGAVKEVVLRAVRDVPGILERPAPDVLVKEYGESAVVYEVRFWITEFKRRESIAAEVLGRIWYQLRRAGMEIPFPIRTLNIPPPEMAADDTAARFDLLRRAAFLEPLTDDDVRLLSSAAEVQRFTAGEVVVRQGEKGRTFYALVRGEVEVRVDGRFVGVLRAPDFFGEISVFTGEPRTATVVAASEIELLCIGHEPIREILGRNPGLAPRLSEALAARKLALSPAEPAATGPRPQEVRAETESLLWRIRRFLGLGGAK